MSPLAPARLFLERTCRAWSSCAWLCRNGTRTETRTGARAAAARASSMASTGAAIGRTGRGWRARRGRAAAGAVRPGVGSTPLRASLGLGMRFEATPANDAPADTALPLLWRDRASVGSLSVAAGALRRTCYIAGRPPRVAAFVSARSGLERLRLFLECGAPGKDLVAESHRRCAVFVHSRHSLSASHVCVASTSWAVAFAQIGRTCPFNGCISYGVTTPHGRTKRVIGDTALRELIDGLEAFRSSSRSQASPDTLARGAAVSSRILQTFLGRMRRFSNQIRPGFEPDTRAVPEPDMPQFPNRTCLGSWCRIRQAR